MRRKTALFLGLVLLHPPAAASQPAPQSPSRPTESITVTGVKPSREAIENFLHSHTAPTRILGKIARWKIGVCPLTVGLGETFTKFVSRRIRDVAAKAGAPVNAKQDCKPNIRVVFTTRPQELLDNIRRDQPVYLGYYQSRVESAQLATVTRPIQSWYTTATADLGGSRQIDSAKAGGTTVDFLGMTSTGDPGTPTAASAYQLNLGSASVRSVTGNRLDDGLSSEFFSVTIVAEPAKLMDHQIGTLADYIAVLALSEPGPLEDCAEFPTILNLLVPGCNRIAVALTEGDLAYLKALYKMSPTTTLAGQRGGMRFQMEQALK